MVCRGAFKLRGACNAILSLSDDDARKSVTTHSSGQGTVALGFPEQVVQLKCHRYFDQWEVVLFFTFSFKAYISSLDETLVWRRLNLQVFSEEDWKLKGKGGFNPKAP